MAVQSIILGTISGISKFDYEKLKKDLDAYFEKAWWKDNTLSVSSTKKHDSIKKIATKIANCICEGEYGSLLFIGNNRVVCIFFGHKCFVGKPYLEPDPPEWWGLQKKEPQNKRPANGSFLDAFKKIKL